MQADESEEGLGVAGYVFISYNNGDRDYVEVLADYLGRMGIPTWYDRDLVAVDSLADVIRERIDNSSAFVVVMTPGSLRSKWVRGELERAQDKDIPVYPVLLAGEASAWLQLGDQQHEDVTDRGMPGTRFIDDLGRRISEARRDTETSRVIRRPRQVILGPPSHAFSFGGRSYRDPRSLVQAFQVAWGPAVHAVRSPSFYDWIFVDVQDPSLSRNILEGVSPDVGIMRLAAHYARDLPPYYLGRRADAIGILETAVAADGGDQESMNWIDRFLMPGEQLDLTSRHACTAGHPACADRSSCQVLQEVIAAVLEASPPLVARDRRKSHETSPHLRIRLARSSRRDGAQRIRFIRGLLDPGYEAELREEYGRIPPEAREVAWFKEYTDVADADESTKEILAARITAIAEADRAVAERTSEISIARGGLVLAVIAAIVVVLLDVWMYVSFRQHVQTIPRLGDPGGSGFSDLWQLIASGFYYVCAYAICPLATLVAIGSLLSYAGDPNVGKKRGSIEA